MPFITDAQLATLQQALTDIQQLATRNEQARQATFHAAMVMQRALKEYAEEGLTDDGVEARRALAEARAIIAADERIADPVDAMRRALDRLKTHP